jgi:adenylate cyclase
MIDEISKTSRQMTALNADIVGFSRLMADDPVTTSTTVESYRSLVEEAVSSFGGTLINFVGDSFMALFDDALAAMRAAVSISESVEQHNEEVPRSKWVRFRMGADQGEVTSLSGETFGDPLNVAARIQERARPGGISVSGRVFRALDEPELRFRPTGKHKVKNIPEMVEIYDFLSLPRNDDFGTQTHRRFSLRSPTIVVIPVIMHHVSDEVRAMCEVLRADLIHRLTEIPQLDVIESDSAEQLTGERAYYILETGVIQVGDNIRTYCKVTAVDTMNFVSSHKWNSTTDTLFGDLEKMIEEVARAIEVELIVGDRIVFYEETQNPRIVQIMIKGWYHLMVGTPEDWLEAMAMFERVVAENPDYTVAQSLLAFGTWLGAAEGLAPDPEGLYDLAYSRAEHVIADGDPTGLGHMIQGAIHIARGEPDLALETIERAHISRPTCDVTYALEGSVRRYLGQWEKAVDLLDTAMRLSAYSPPWYATVQACSLFIGERLDLAEMTAQEIIETQPDNLEALLVLAAAQVELGLERRARATAEVISQKFPALDVAEWLDNHPYRDRRIVERWRDDLTTAGLVKAN